MEIQTVPLDSRSHGVPLKLRAFLTQPLATPLKLAHPLESMGKTQGGPNVPLSCWRGAVCYALHLSILNHLLVCVSLCSHSAGHVGLVCEGYTTPSYRKQEQVTAAPTPILYPRRLLIPQTSDHPSSHPLPSENTFSKPFRGN